MWTQLNRELYEAWECGESGAEGSEDRRDTTAARGPDGLRAGPALGALRRAVRLDFRESGRGLPREMGCKGLLSL